MTRVRKSRGGGADEELHAPLHAPLRAERLLRHHTHCTPHAHTYYTHHYTHCTPQELHAKGGLYKETPWCVPSPLGAVVGVAVNPYLVGSTGPSAVLDARVCRLLEAEVGPQLRALRTRLRGVDQEAAFQLLAVRQASDAFVPMEEQKVAAKPEQAPPSEWVGSSDAARLLGISPRGVAQARSRGRLPGHMTDGRWRFRIRDVENYRKEREQRWRG